MRKPILEDFDMTSKQFEDASTGLFDKRFTNRIIVIISFLVGLGVAIASALEFGGTKNGIGEAIAMGLGIGFFTLLATTLITAIISIMIKYLNPISHKVKLYNEALRNYFQSSEDYWKSLGGKKFEIELANLYSKLGFSAKLTPDTDDKGIDIFLNKDDKTIIVQCKAHKNPIGPAVARELYGTLIACGANSAILASPSGFTKGVKNFVIGKPIELISINELIRIAEEADSNYK
ncbi:MAG: restriction endonuclease [Dehalococcoidales bacterium]